jgi:YVTN family beta-propeller protein
MLTEKAAQTPRLFEFHSHTPAVAAQAGPSANAVTSTLVYITDLDNSTVSVIDTATNTVTTTIPVGTGPSGVAVTPDGATVYVANQFSSTVTVIDTATNTVTTTIPDVGVSPFGLAVTPGATSAVSVTADPPPWSTSRSP